MNSSFRIDRNSVAASNPDINDVVVIPGLSEIVEAEAEKQAVENEAAEAAEDAEAVDEEEKQNELDAKQEELRALQQQIEETKAVIAEMLSQAESDAEAMKQKAAQDGYNDGMAQAEAAAQEQRAREQQEFGRLTHALASARDQIAEQMEASVLELSVYIAEKVIKEALDRNDALFLNIVKDTLAKVKDQEDIVLRLNQKEYERFFADDSEQFTALLRSSGIQIKQDIAVESGECVIETEYGTVRSGIKTQLRRMAGAMNEAG